MRHKLTVRRLLAAKRAVTRQTEKINRANNARWAYRKRRPIRP